MLPAALSIKITLAHTSVSQTATMYCFIFSAYGLPSGYLCLPMTMALHNLDIELCAVGLVMVYTSMANVAIKCDKYDYLRQYLKLIRETWLYS